MAKYSDDDFEAMPDPIDDALNEADAASQDDRYDDILEVQAAEPFDASPPDGPMPAAIAASQVACSSCGYDLTGVQIGSQCPECGVSVSRSFQAMRTPSSGMATASMVLGIVSITVTTMTCGCMGFAGLVCGVLAIAFYIQVRNDIKAGRISPQVSGTAMAGLICGIIGTVLGVATTLLFIGVGVFSP